MKYVFIGGCGRSGTSLLQNLLVQHELVTGSSEFNFTNRILELRRRMQDDFFKQRNQEFYDEQSLRSSYRNFIESFFEKITASKPSAQWISEKTPNNILVINDILEVFDDGRFIYVYRDGRDVVNSYLHIKERLLKQHKPAEFNVFSICEQWNSARFHRNALNPLFNNRVLDVCYERLIETPDESMAEIQSWLELPIQNLHAMRMHDDAKDTVHHDNLWFTDHQKRKAIDTASRGLWKKELGLMDKLISNVYLAEGLYASGYPVHPAFLTLAKWLRAIR